MTPIRIGGYSAYAGINRIKASENVASQIQSTTQSVSNDSINLNAQQDNQPENRAPKKIDNIENFNFDFGVKSEYNLVGATSKLEDLDVEKAISDMKKDSVLDQYKFFVKTALTSDEDGSVRQVIRGN